MKKIIVSLIVFGVLVTSSPVHALTLSDLEKEIQNLKAEIASLKSMLPGQVMGAVVTYTKTYYKGMYGVLEFQKALTEQGYLPAGNITDYFGNNTYTAVVNFQKAKGLPVDGVLGPITQNLLLSGGTDATATLGGPELACAPNTWVKRANFGGEGRQGPFGFSVGNKGYIGGGSVPNWDNGGNGVVADFWEYDSTKNIWTQKADYGGGPRAEATGFSIGSKGYVGTGYWVEKKSSGYYTRDTKDFYEYNPTTNTWTRKTDFGGSERNNATGLSIGSKGYIGTGDFSKDFWEYNPTTDAWTKKADFGGERRDGAVGFAINGKGYIGTGDLSPANTTILKDFWEYNPDTDAWRQRADVTGTIYANGAGFAIKDKGYVQTGSNFQEYDPATNKWTAKANFPLLYLATDVGFSIGNYGYIGGGNNAGTRTKDFWMYCPGIVN